ncbi:MAG TPA: phosphodiester glycosidase family protein [Clostridia bacterium]|nr:phosphodiester glycosidase family protein [Clostridia bacterium]
MNKMILKPYRWAMLFSAFLTVVSAFILLEAFVLPQAISPAKVDTANALQSESTMQLSPTPMVATVTGTSYQDDNISVSIETLRRYSSTVYVADVELSDAKYLKTALAENTFGKNIKQRTSEIAEEHQAIFAVNGDYYGFRNSGYVLRNGVIYRNKARESGDDDALVIDNDGNFSIISESKAAFPNLNTDDIAQIFSFGPALISDGQILVDENSEVGRSKSSNPRTAIGQVEALHYIVIVSDGRTKESEGLSLAELTALFVEKGCTTAYNLDGGGSSAMYFNGRIVNEPTDGRNQGERDVSDIVYFGY